MKNIDLAKAIAIHQGISGRLSCGGWLYQGNKVVCQGWFAYMQQCKNKGWIVDRNAPFESYINWRKIPQPYWMSQTHNAGGSNV